MVGYLDCLTLQCLYFPNLARNLPAKQQNWENFWLVLAFMLPSSTLMIYRRHANGRRIPRVGFSYLFHAVDAVTSRSRATEGGLVTAKNLRHRTSTTQPSTHRAIMNHRKPAKLFINDQSYTILERWWWSARSTDQLSSSFSTITKQRDLRKCVIDLHDASMAPRTDHWSVLTHESLHRHSDLYHIKIWKHFNWANACV